MIDKIKTIIRSLPIPLSKNHAYDLQTIKVIKKVCKINSNCIDVGCHKGEIMDLILKNAPKGFHFGFEPLPDFYENLVVKYAQNHQIKIFDIALADQTGETSYNYVVSNPAYSGLIKRTYDRPSEVDAQIRVKTDLLDNCIDKDVKIDFIKIDVEGGEYQVLLGAKELIKSSQPIVIFEHGKGASDAYGTTPSLIFAYFEDLNYKIYTMSAWLKSQNSFTKEEFVNEYENNRNYYFLAAI